MKDVEKIRNEAANVGFAVTFALFGMNEVARLTLRSPLFKLKLQNVLFFGLAPSLICRYSYNQSVSDRVDNLWRIHKNREKQGLGGTFKK